MEQLSTLQTLLPGTTSPREDNEILHEKSRSVKMCYTSYKLLVFLFMIIVVLIMLFLKDLTSEQNLLNILREIRFGKNMSGNFSFIEPNQKTFG